VTAACGRKRDSARRWLVALAAAVGCALAAGLAAPGVASAASAGGATASATASAAGDATWYPARQAVNPEHFDITVDDISCTAPGDCTATGAYQEVINYKYVFEGFVMDERGGVWGGVQPIPGLLALNTGGYATIAALSCASPGNCLVGGSYDDSHNNSYAFIAGERDGKWGGAQEVPGTAALNTGDFAAVSSVSCDAPGDCAATGSYEIGGPGGPTELFVSSETGGTWRQATEIPGYGDLNASARPSVLSSVVACTRPGDCTLFGDYYPAPYEERTFVTGEMNGTWGGAAPLPGAGTATVNALSCVSPGNCVAGGSYLGGSMTVAQAAVWRETSGTWSAAQFLTSVVALNDTASGQGSDVTLLSCTSLTSCGANGSFTKSAFEPEPYVIDETGGAWGDAQQIPGLAALGAGPDSAPAVAALSCWSPGYCTLGGYYSYETIGSWDYDTGFLADETGGTWGKAHYVPGLRAPRANSPNASDVTAVSCTADGFCGAAGADSDTYAPNDVVGAFLVNKAVAVPTSTAMAVSTLAVTYGDERAVRVSVAVAAASGTAFGPVPVKAGSAVACLVTLRDGTGSCTLPATRFAPGVLRLTADYGGAVGFAASASAAVAVRVARAATATGLRLSAAEVTYGHEQAETLTVAVTPRYAGTPTGTVTVSAGTATVCVIALRSRAGRCTLSAQELGPGAYALVARYAGGADFAGSASGGKNLTVAE
jgi:Bacterial Ig-like domain (group 3)